MRPTKPQWSDLLPTEHNTAVALGTVGPPQNVGDPNKWIPLIPNPAKGYQIVGWTTWDLATCNETKGEANAIIGFLNDYLNANGLANDKLIAHITSFGFTPISGATASKPPAPGSMAATIVDNHRRQLPDKQQSQ
jgi:hypothetical protein